MKYLLLALGAFSIPLAISITPRITEAQFYYPSTLTPEFVIGFIWFLPIALIGVSLMLLITEDK